MNNAFFRYNQDFVLFGRQHLLMILLTVALCIALPLVAKQTLNRRQQIWVARGMSLTFFVWVILYIVIRIGLGDFDRSIDVPLDICNLVALLLPFVMWNPSQKVHEVLYFWILAGTFQAVLTPYLFNGYPNFTFIKYWIVHGGLIVYAVYVTVVLGLRPGARGIWKALFTPSMSPWFWACVPVREVSGKRFSISNSTPWLFLGSTCCWDRITSTFWASPPPPRCSTTSDPGLGIC
jgi:hypothetical integral membrane protein (TIGR02206 family)